MRIKELFTVPDGTKITEKVFSRVRLSSICSILLCMACLAGTTRAWFTVSIENTENVIQIATVRANVSITTDGVRGVVPESPDNRYALEAGTYAIAVKLENNSTEWNRPVYVLMSVVDGEESHYYCFTFEPNSSEPKRIEICKSNSVTVSFSVSWVEPASAMPVGNGTVVAGGVPTEPTTEPSTETSAATTEPSTEIITTPATEVTTTPKTEPATELSMEETTIPTTETTESTGETEGPTEESTVIPTTENTAEMMAETSKETD